MIFWKKFSRTFSPDAVKVVIYSKPECHLCEEAKAQLLRIQKRHGFQLDEVDISRDEKLLAEFGTRIPLIWVNGRLVAKYEVNEAALVDELRRASTA
jgi:glutaredoxin